MTEPLHVYTLLDVSASMHGAPVESLRQGLQSLVGTLIARSKRPVQIAIITYESTPTLLMPLADVTTFGTFPIPRTFPTEGTSGLGAALRFLLDSLPAHDPALLYIFTDGEPTDDWESVLPQAADRLNAIYGLICGLIADPRETALAAHLERIFRMQDLTPDRAFDTFRTFALL
jgi:uncharacterized protein YegL